MSKEQIGPDCGGSGKIVMGNRKMRNQFPLIPHDLIFENGCYPFMPGLFESSIG